MKTDIFGQSITYYREDEVFKDKLSDFVIKNKFTTFSPEGITSYLTFRHPIGEYTMFSDIKKLPFGTKFNIDKKKEVFWLNCVLQKENRGVSGFLELLELVLLHHKK